MTIKALVRRPIKRHIRRSVRRAVDLRDYFANDEEGFLGSPAFANLYATYLQAANITAYGDATGFVKNTLPATDKFLILSGASGTYASTPDAAALDITGDIDIRAHVALRDWTPAASTALVAKYTTTGNQRSYDFFVTATTGVLALIISADGTSAATTLYSSTAAPTVTDGESLHVRVTLDVDNGASNSAATFYTSTDGSTWTQLGNVVNSGGVVSIFSSTAPLEIGSIAGGAGDRLAGKVYSAQVYNGINGTKVFDLTPNSYVSGSAYTCGTGQTVTLQGIAIIVPNELQFYQPTSAARPVAAFWPKTGVRSRLTYSNDFSNAIWTKAQVNLTANAIDGPIPLGMATKVAATAVNGSHAVTRGVNVGDYPYSIYCKAGEITKVRVDAFWNNGPLTYYVVVNLLDGSIVATQFATLSVTDAGDGWWRIGISRAVSGGATTFRVYLYDDVGGITFTGDGTSGLYIYGFQQDWITGGVTTYQQVTDSNHITEYGVPDVPGVRGDGTDDFLNSGVTAIGGSHFFAEAGQGCCIAIPLVMIPGVAACAVAAKAGSSAAAQQLQMAVGSDGLLDITVRGTANTDLETVADGLPHYLIYNQDGAAATYMFDGLTETALTVGSAAEEILETFMLFARTTATPANFGNFRLGLDDLVVINQSLTLFERQQLMQNAASNFGVTLS